MAERMGPLAMLGVYRRLVGARIRGNLQYRAAFWLRVVAAFFLTTLDIVVILLVFGRVDQLQGWTLAEVAFLFGTSGVAFQVADLLIGGIEHLSTYIKQGSFDRYLTRPIGPMGQLAADQFALRRIGNLTQALVVFVVALAAVDVDWSARRVATLVVLLLAGAAIYAAVFVVATSVAFWTVDAQEFGNAFTYGGNFLSQYPMTIYGEWLRRLLAFVVPVAFVSYFPALYILGRTDPADRFGLPSAVMFASPLVAAAAWLVAAALWRSGLRHYRSTGS